MSFSLTERAENASLLTKLKPQLVLEIEGVSTLYGAIEILKVIRIGDTGLLIGNTWKIGGLSPAEDQQAAIAFDGLDGLKIDQQISPDKGSVSSVSSVQVKLIDKNFSISELVSPGIILENDILGAKATLWMGFENVAFKEDYLPIFSGIIDDVDAGCGDIKLNIAHAEQLKRQQIFNSIEVELESSVDISQVTIPLVNASNLLRPVLGPDGTYDSAIKYFLKIEDEIIQYSGISGNDLTGCIRGSLATIPQVHTIDADPIMGNSMVSIEDAAINCALKIMLSGTNDFYLKDKPIKRFNFPSPLEQIPNTIYFQDIDLNRDCGVVVGDYVTITGATNSENNTTAKPIIDLIVINGGSYAVIGDVEFSAELETSATVSFRSQFDTLGVGLALRPDLVDINEHIFWHNFQLASFNYRFIIEETINGKEFLDKEIYMPIGAFSLPRQGRASMGYHVGPVARTEIKTINKYNIKSPEKIRLRRSTNKNFYNTIIYKFEKLVSNGKFVSGAAVVSQDSKSRIKEVGTKALTISSSGMRRDLDGVSIAERVAGRYLGRYQFAAEFFESISLFFKDGCTIEPGDPIIFDPTDLKILNSTSGNRNSLPKVFIVSNKKQDAKTGEVVIALIDANSDGSERYGGIAPSSEIISGTTEYIIIKDSFGALYPSNESKKWREFLGLSVLIHSPNWENEQAATLLEIDKSNKNRLNFVSPIATAPNPGDILEVANFPTGDDVSENALYKSQFAFLGASVQIISGIDETNFTVAPEDVYKFKIGNQIKVRNFDFSFESEILKIENIVGETITLSAALSVVPDDSYFAENLGFNDGSKEYLFY